MFTDHTTELTIKFEEKQEELELLDDIPENFKKGTLHFAFDRIKKIMKSEGDVQVGSSLFVPNPKMVSEEAVFLMSKATELFILDLTFMSSFYKDEGQIILQVILLFYF